MVDEKNWTIDRKVNLSFILALLAQTVIGVMYVTSLANTVEQSTKDISKLEVRVQASEVKSVYLQEGLIRLEEQSKNQTKILERIDKRLEGFPNNQQNR